MCGCLGSNTKSKTKSRAKSRQVKQTISIKNTEVVCNSLMEEMKEVERKNLFLLSKDITNSILSESNRQIRIWLRELRIKCPDEYKYNVIKEYIENEYTEYNS